MRTMQNKSLRRVAIQLYAQGVIVKALTPHLTDAVYSGDEELNDLLDREIDKAQAKVRNLAAAVEACDESVDSNLRTKVAACREGIDATRER